MDSSKLDWADLGFRLWGFGGLKGFRGLGFRGFRGPGVSSFRLRVYVAKGVGEVRYFFLEVVLAASGAHVYFAKRL